MKNNVLLITTLSFCLAQSVFGATSSDYSQLPPGLTQDSAPPVVMLTMPKDHQLFFKAYSDYEDINGDGKPETTYNPTIDYIGYFDNRLCYEYNGTNKYFEPKAYAKQIVTGAPAGNQIQSTAVTNANPVSAFANNNGYYCNTLSGTAHWSGNFLNWASMTRMDILRSVFYGGKRATTQPAGLNGVLLERSQIPGDAHSFAKYYGASDLPFLTPYAVEDTSLLCTGTHDNNACRQVRKGITLCNTTLNSTDSSDDHKYSQNTDNPPLIRAARGNFSLWATTERFQCKFKDATELSGMTWNNTSGVQPANNATVLASGYNALMDQIFGSSTTPAFYFFHDSPSVNTTVADTYIYEPNYPAGSNQQLTPSMYARVVACSSTLTAYSSKCTSYNGTLKPTGILQNSDPNIYWGLMSGSFEHNTQGGALRKHVGLISTEIDPSTGNFIPQAAGGLIAFMDNLRILNWNYGASTDVVSVRNSYVSWENGNCGADDIWNVFPKYYGKIATFSDGQCRSWGNPYSEILMDAYNYLAGKTAPQKAATDQSFFTNPDAQKAMTTLNWSQNPLKAAPVSPSTLKSCSKLNVLAINGSAVSYEGDLPFTNSALSTYTAKTTTIGQKELTASTQYFTPGYPKTIPVAPSTTSVQETSADGTKVCVPSTISDLSAVTGTCPEAPALSGSYQMAGMAYEANITSNINPNYGKGIQTSAISLAMGSSQIEIPTANNKVVMLPACRNKTKKGSDFLGSCALVDFKILQRSVSGDSGSYLVVWEDSQQGGDFDQDAIQLINYSYTNPTLTITTKILSTSTNDLMELGYTIAGVEADKEGYRGVIRFNTGSPTTDVTTNISFYTPSSSVNKSLNTPLYYAAKWGGFKDLDGNGVISNTLEWDKFNNTTQEPYDPDGIPDNYSVVVNPDALYGDITRLLRNIGPTVFSYSTNGSINVLDDNSGFNISTLFRPVISSDTGGVIKTLNWTSSLNIYARDANGYLHEDTNKNGQYDSSDKIITFETAANTTDTMANLHPANQTPTAANIQTSTPLSDLNFSTPYWSAEQNLARVVNYSTQAAYVSKRSDKRYIFTAFDTNNDSIINASDATYVPFDISANGFPATGTNSIRSRWLDTPLANMPNLIEYIRGKESATYRSRRLDFIPSYSNDADDNSTTTTTDGLEPWLLGDIVHSSPLVVSTPKSAFDRFFGDDTYTTFRTKYATRRSVVYVGANDGMLHAFNLGKFDAASGQYLADTNYALGSELWAYVPFNLLPHLKWLSEKNYQHNFYIDGAPKSYDVNIFPSDTVHPGGWGTLLVTTMRTGGTPYDIDIDGNGTKDRTLRSAVILMDITNPDAAPSLLAEIPLPDNTYTTVNPDVIKIRTRGSDYKFNGPGATNQWYLALASGVTDPKRHISTKAPNLYLYDLSLSNGIRLVNTLAISTNPGAVGGINARDWNGDFKDDYLYFGTIEGTPAAQSGQLFRVSIQPGGVLGTPTPILNVTNQVFAATPFTTVDKKGNYWVFTGTGRYFSDEDNLYTDKQNSYYAVKETLTATGINGTSAVNTLVNLTGVSVKTDDNLTQSVTFGSKTATNRTTLADAIDSAKGWYFNFSSLKSRNYTATILVNNSLLFNTYEPGDSCQPLGTSSQYKRDFLTGIPSKRNNTSTVTAIDQARIIGIGAASDPVPGKNAATNTSLGAVDLAPDDDAPSTNVRQSWRELPYDQ